MECGLCGTLNRDLARFCGGCGAPLGRVCPNCKSEIDAGLRFCDQCGTEVDATPVAPAAAPLTTPGSSPEAVRKTVTVLFADLGGSTGFGERTDPEIARQVLARYHAMLQQAIDAHGGTVAKFMGDGMMATFGIPEIAEDDAERAVRAGIEIQDRFSRFAADIAARYGETLTARVGINTGEIVIGAADADLVGDALNVAARLEKACRPGHVLVGEETWRVTRGVLAYEPLGEVMVAGRAQPVGTYEVSSVERRSAEPVAPFVGREGELARLRVAFDRAVADRTAVLVTVLGSPGLGKTRLSREFLAGLDAIDAAATYEIRCDRAGTATFAPVADLVRAAIGLGDAETEDSVRERLTALLDGIEDVDRVVDGLLGVLGVAPLRSVEETFWSVRRGLEALAAVRPLVVVIDDIQWAEPKLLDLAEHLQEWVTDAPVLLVGLARPELRELRPTFVEPGRRVADVLALDGLDARATEELAARLLGSALPRDLVARLPVSTDGNPLFVRELVRMLVDDRVIVRRDDGGWELAIDAEAIEVPPTIQSLLATRVERLPADELRVLECASVVGAEFSVGALRALVGDGPDIPTLLERMRRRELVEPTGSYWGDDPVHRFHHVLIRDAAYRRLLKGARAELHRQVGEWTEASAIGASGEHEITVGFHFEQAHRYRTELGFDDDETERLGARAAELLETAARRALEGDDLTAAGALARRALAVLPVSDRETQPSLLLMACESLLASGDVVAGAPLVEQLAQSTGADARLAAWAECFRAQLVGLTEPEGLVEAEALAAQAAITFDALGDGAGEAKAHQVRALLLARLGRVGEAETVLDLALSAARAADDRRRVTAVLGAAPQAALFGPSPVARAGGRCLDVVRLLRITTASPSVEATSMRCQAVLEALRGRFDVSRSMLASSRTALEELGLRHGLLETDLFAGMVELIAGDAAAAVVPLRAAYEGLGTLGVGADAGQAAALLATALLAQGEVDEAELMAAESEALAGQNLKTAIAWRTAKAEVFAARGDLDEGVALASEAVAIAAGTDLVLDHADACAVLADLCDATGDAAGAGVARAEALRLYEAKGATVPAARVGDASVPPAPSAPDLESPRVTAAAGAPLLDNAAFAAERAVIARLDRFLRDEPVPDDPGYVVVDDFVHEDRRAIVALPRLGVEGVRDVNASMREQGFVEVDTEPVAVRGDRLCLSRRRFRSVAGDEIRTLALTELDAEGRIVAGMLFDREQLDEAVTELDDRWLLGEGRDHSAVVGPVLATERLVASRDFDPLPRFYASGFVAESHARLGIDSDLTGYLEWWKAVAETTPDVRAVPFAQRVHGGEVLRSWTISGRTAEGNRYEWVTHVLTVVGADGLITRVEFFDPEHLDEVDEVATTTGATPGPRPDNAAAAAMARVIDLCHERRFDEMRTMLTDDFVREDRRHGVAAPEAVGAEEFIRAYAAWFEVGFDTLAMEPVATRGDRSVLAQLEWRSPDGRRVGFLGVYELATDGRFVAGVHFDEDDLDAALTELDTRFIAREGAPSLPVLAAGLAWIEASRNQDLEALRAVTAPDLVCIDHSPIGFGTLGRDGLLAATQLRLELSADDVVIVRSVLVDGPVVLAVHYAETASETGGHYEREAVYVLRVDGDGRIDRWEVFGEDQYDVALARFRELSGPQPEGIENAATRVIARSLDLMNRGEWDELVALNVVADGVVRFDRRRTVSAPTVGDSESFGANAAGIHEVFGVVRPEPVAVRGERLALVRLHCGEAPASTMQLLVVYDVDADGRIVREADFDDDDVDGALDELDERYLAGEGAEHAYVVERIGDFRYARAARDWDAVEELFAEDYVAVDRRRLGMGPGTRAQYLDASKAMVDLVPDATFVPRTIEVHGDVVLMRTAGSGTSVEGGRSEWEQWVVWRFAAGRVVRGEVFGLEDEASARARFTELAAQTLTPDIDNRAVRLSERARWLDRYGVGDGGALFSDDCVLEDRRTGVNEGLVSGGDAVTDSVRSGEETIGELRTEPIAVRGERLALMRWTFVADGGFESPGLSVLELDRDDRVCRLVSFSEDQLADAIEDLEGRHLELRGSEVTPLELANARGARTFNARDWNAFAPLWSPEFSWIAHSQLGGGGDLADYLRTLEILVEQIPDVTVVYAKVVSRGRVGISVLPFTGTTPEGNRYSWSFHQVAVIGEDGLVRRFELFDEDQWDAAVDRFEELSAEVTAGGTAVDVPHPENAATRILQAAASLLWTDLDAALGFFTPDVVGYARETGPTAGASAEDPARWLDVLTSLAATYDDLRLEPLAVRGDRLALLRQEFVAHGFVTPALLVVELDEHDRITRLETFADDDVATATAHLDSLAAGLRPASPVDLGESARPPDPVNRATRLVQQATERRLRGESTDDFYAPECRIDDRRTVVSAGTAAGASSARELIRSGIEVFGDLAIEPIAVRGERLMLARWAFIEATGFESGGIVLIEIDEHDRLAGVTTFDDTDLWVAVEALEARYLEIDADRVTQGERNHAAAAAAYQARDFDAFAAVMDPEFQFRDHSPIGFGELGRDDYVAGQLEFARMMPKALPVSAKQYGSANAAIVSMPTLVRDADGGEFEWPTVHVLRVGASGRTVEMAGFEQEQWEEALALFDEWSTGAADLAEPMPDNACVRATLRMYELIAAGDPGAGALVAEDVDVEDRRHTVSLPHLHGRAEVEAAATGSLGTLGVSQVTPIAVRGERLALFDDRAGAEGFEVAALTLTELDADGRLCSFVMFDESDLAAALAELDQRHADHLDEATEEEVEPELSDDDAGLAAATLWNVLDRQDVELLDRIVTPRVAFVDHLPNGLPSVRSAEGLAKAFRRLFDLAPDTTFVVGDPVSAGPAAMLDVEQRSTAPSGTQYRWDRVVVVGCAPDGRIDAIECFAPDDRSEAEACFVDWSAGPDVR